MPKPISRKFFLFVLCVTSVTLFRLVLVTVKWAQKSMKLKLDVKAEDVTYNDCLNYVIHRCAFFHFSGLRRPEGTANDLDVCSCRPTENYGERQKAYGNCNLVCKDLPVLTG